MTEQNTEKKDTKETDTKKGDTKKTEFKPLIEQEDRYLWALAMVPIAGALLEFAWPVHFLISIVFYTSFYTLFGYLDYLQLIKTNRQTPKHWLVYIVPVYIWQRLKINQQSMTFFYVWCAALFLSFAIDSIAMDNELKEVSCDLVTQILYEEEFGAGSYNSDFVSSNRAANPRRSTPSCVEINIYQSVTDKIHKAMVTLDDGDDLDILIKEKGDMIEVTIKD